MQGQDAFDELYEKKQLSVSNDSDHQDVVEQVLSAFQLPDNYEQFEIEIKFNDGTELEFEHQQ